MKEKIEILRAIQSCTDELRNAERHLCLGVYWDSVKDGVRDHLITTREEIDGILKEEFGILEPVPNDIRRVMNTYHARAKGIMKKYKELEPGEYIIDKDAQGKYFWVRCYSGLQGGDPVMIADDGYETHHQAKMSCMDHA